MVKNSPKFPQWLSKRLEGFDDAEERSFWRKHCEVRGRVLEGMCYLLTVRECVCGGVCAGKCVRCQVGLCVPSPVQSCSYASRSLPGCSAECLARTDVNAPPRQEYVEMGFTVVRNVFSPELIRALIDGAENILHARTRRLLCTNSGPSSPP